MLILIHTAKERTSDMDHKLADTTGKKYDPDRTIKMVTRGYRDVNILEAAFLEQTLR